MGWKCENFKFHYTSTKYFPVSWELLTLLIMKIIFGLLCFFSIVAQANTYKIQTNLGSKGNSYVAQRFNQYKNSGFICDTPKQNQKRVILTGFGPFAGHSENPTSTVVQAFGNFTVSSKNVDAVGVTRDVNINGENYQICFMVVATMWDLSSAIVVTEMEHFSPHFVLMSGLSGTRSKAILETGNSNRARAMDGFSLNGSTAADNEPEENYVLPPTDPSVPFISQLSWDAYKAKAAIDADMTSLGFEAFIAAAGYESNDYVCNNIAFVVTHAAKSLKTELAGGQITLHPNLSITPKVGFLHYPYDVSTNATSVQKWIEILSKIISSQI